MLVVGVFYVPATSKVISRCVATYDRVHSWRLYSAAPLGNQATHIPLSRIILTLSEPVLARLGSDKYKIYKSLV